MAMSPAAVVIRTAVIPGPSLIWARTGTFSRFCSHADSNSADGLARSASTVTDLIRAGYWSNAAASSPRHRVSRVQARSVSPGR